MRIRILVLASLSGLALLPGRSADAQGAFTVRPESRVILLGKSNVHSWRCATSTFVATIDVDSVTQRDSTTGLAKSIVRLSIIVPVRSMNCGRARMNEDMYKALKADSFPEIRYVLTSYTVDEHAAAADSFDVRSVGELTVAGKTKRVELRVNGGPGNATSLRGEGGVRLLMTDFGIKPPTAFLGAIRTKNAIEVRIDARISRSDLVASARVF